MSFELNGQQKLAVKGGKEWFLKGTKPTFEISGPAGSGKTSIVYAITEELGLDDDAVLFMAFVGKATMELSMKGNNAKTIHSTIYDLIEVPVLDADGVMIMKNGRPKLKPQFVKKPSLPENIKLLVLDEGGMVNKELGRDILSYGIPLLVLGDLDQLPPVFGESLFLFRPDVILTEIMRQAKGDPIIHLSQMAKKGIHIPIGKYGERCYVIDKSQISDEMLTGADTIICGRNKTRDQLNKHIRYNILNRTQDNPMYGDKIICRQNNWNLSLGNGIFLINGMVGTIEDINLQSYNKNSIKIDFRPDFVTEGDDIFKNIEIDFKYLFMNHEEKKQAPRSYYNRFEFGWAITTHLSQGSQYPKVLLFNERMGDQRYYNRWLYTAITRAKTHLVIGV